MSSEEYWLRAIGRTLSYAAIFRFPLRGREIWRRLISPRPLRWSRLQPLLQRGQPTYWQYRRGYYFLQNCRCRSRSLGRRLSREKEQLLLNPLLKAWQPLKTIKLLALSGSVASENAYPGDDLDLFIISQPGWLWRSRLLAEWRLRRAGLPRRQPKQTQARNQLCPNVWLAGDALRLPRRQQNLFVAMELLQLKVVLNRDHYWQRFLAANRAWIGRYLANWQQTWPKLAPAVTKQSSSLGEKLAFWLQRIYMWRHHQGEDVRLGQAFFHPHDFSSRVLKKYRRYYQAWQEKVRLSQPS